MKTITLTKPDGTKFQVNDRRSGKPQVNLQTFQSGYTEPYREEELLLPAGFQLNEKTGEISFPHERDKNAAVQSNHQKQELLLPLGIEIED